MLDNIVFSLDRVMPFFLLILLGYGLKRFRLVPQEFLNSVNRYVYRVALPANLFFNTATMDMESDVDPRFLAFALLLTLASFFAVWGVMEALFRDKTLVGTLVQGGFRSNYSLLGVPLATSVVGAAGAAPSAMALAVIIPTYAICSVTVLLVRGKRKEKPNVKNILVGVLTTPLFLGVLVGILWAALRIPLPAMVKQTVGYVSGTATPLGLMAIGGLFNLEAATARLRPALYAAAIKILILPAAMVGLAYLLGFRGTPLFLFFVMFGAPVAVSSYSVATELGGDSALASNILIITTLFSSVTLAVGIYVMRTLGWI